MQRFTHLPADERRRLCDEATATLGFHAVAVEKDFWVCWTLEQLFALPEWGPHLTFKGGTSLSKAWQLIQRFSEDIDIVVDRDWLGFGGALGPEHAPSRKQARLRLEQLKAACQVGIRESLLPDLRARFASLLPRDAEWTLEEDEHDPDGQTLVFSYPAVIGAQYVRPTVRIELGARSDIDPCEQASIRAYLADTCPDVVGTQTFAVRALAPRRTFWEKAMLLHEERCRPEERQKKPRLARHYYDLWALIRAGVGTAAVSDAGLFERIAAHREVYFRWSWMDYSTLRRGSLRLTPTEAQLPYWRQDYRKMSDEMLFGDVPSFEEVMATAAAFEASFNRVSEGV